MRTVNDRTMGHGRVARWAIALAAIAVACDPPRTGASSWSDAEAIVGRDATHTTRLTSDPFVRRESGGAAASAWDRATKAQGMTLGVHLPARADGAIDVGLATTEEARPPHDVRGDYVLTLTHEGLASAPLDASDGRAIYRDVAASTDLLVTATDARVEWFYFLRTPDAPAAFALHVALPSGLPRATLERGGSLAFLDAQGKTRLRVARPHAVDATGAARDATLAWDAARERLDVTLDTRGLRYPVVLDPAIEHPVWQEAPFDLRAPSVRTNPAMAYDSVRQRTVLFGGVPFVSGTGDTWEWDGTAWAENVVANAPAQRTGAAMAFDVARGKAILFGGALDGSPSFKDTWQWDGTVWNEVATATAPSARARAAMAYDSTRQLTILFGGTTSSGDVADTWQWDGEAWTALALTSAPSARDGAAMTFDAAHGKVVLFGGGDQNDTWLFNGAWTHASPTTSPPAATNVAMAYDATVGVALLFEGDGSGATWKWSGSNWSSTSASGPSGRTGAELAYDATRGRVVLFGGATSDTWEWSSAGWSLRVPSVVPPPVTVYGGMSFDSARRTTVLFTGSNTWEWDGTVWAQRSPATSPPQRYAGSLVYDAARAKTVLFGGSPDLETTMYNDLWLWDGTNWTQPTVATAPAGRYGASMAYDSRRQRTVLFGGGYNGESYNAYLNDTWEWDGTSWTQIAPATSPHHRISATMVYDTKRGKMVLYGGLWEYPSAPSETWEYDGTNWTNPQVTGPPSTYWGSAAYDQTRGKTILFGGDNADDTWEWDGTSWTSPGTSAPPQRSAAQMTYDAARGVTVLFSGKATYNDFDDTWLYYTVGAACTTTATCDLGACTDGVCCNEAQCGVCQACNLPGSEGTCTSVAAGANDPDSCTAPNMCSAEGACAAPQGTTCSVANDCISGFCVDGVCCDTACSGDCQACSIARGLAQDGTCAFAPEGTAGRNACTTGFVCNGRGLDCPATCTDDATCAAGYFCGAQGLCVAQKTQGASCDDTAGADCLVAGCGECSPVGAATRGYCVDNVCCDTSCDDACATCGGATPGTCATAAAGAVGSPSCAPYVCDGTSTTCPTTCSADADCAAGGSYCDLSAHQCVGTATLGTTCASDDACASGHCVSGVCCQNTCGAASSDGGASSCAAGICDRTNGYACRLPGSGDKSCRAAGCANGVQTYAATCDGEGHCGDLETRTCAPFLCGATECANSCASNTDCTSGATCVKGQCIISAVCSADHSSVVAGDGTMTSCAPYLCASGVCTTSCTSVTDCAQGYVCSTNGDCVASTTAAPSAAVGAASGGCSCRAARDASLGSKHAWFAAALVLLFARRRRARAAIGAIS